MSFAKSDVEENFNFLASDLKQRDELTSEFRQRNVLFHYCSITYYIKLNKEKYYFCQDSMNFLFVKKQRNHCYMRNNYKRRKVIAIEYIIL